ncbi:MAG TPA: alanine--tRNA ligase [Polyangiales bacterium]|nr:alanine--tRNA ligase [Polyangiales bacterium]
MTSDRTSSKQIRDTFRNYFGKRGHEIVPSSSIIPQNDPTLLFVNAGMVQFKDVFTGQDVRSYKRATTSQKCIRISGKHNDLENVGVTARHHTFFEMLGNFSFGDYFKEEAISYAWELFIEELGIDPKRLVVTVFAGEGNLPADDEAAGLWAKIAGLPKERILRCGAADNFWSMGDTGPCGPCSELHYFFGDGEPDLSLFGQEPNADGRGWVELWNLVFMQFNRHKDGTLDKLPAPSIDTGAGLERLACVLQNKVSNYDTDVLAELVKKTADIAGKKYRGTLGADDIAMRVIADHARTTAFMIAEGVSPDKGEREYVLRRVMRRAIRHGQLLGIERAFMHECALLVVDRMGDEYPELRERRALIEDVSQQEEARFRQTLKRGLERLNDYQWPADKSTARVLPGAVAFELYDTYGFPLDLQEVIGRENGFAIDTAGYDKELARAKERSQGSKLSDDAAVEAVYRAIANETGETKFLGYDSEQGDSSIVALISGGKLVDRVSAGQDAEIVTRETPFYGESGGQMGDSGEIRGAGGAARFVVADTHKPVAGLFVHKGKLQSGALAKGDTVTLEVDHARRASTRRNHSATHLLHLALRKVVGAQAMQKGSLVGPDRLRFDYSGSQALTVEQISEIERMVNERVLWNAEVTTEVLSMSAAKEKGAIGIFEEKYGEVVRMLRIADSLELCGGTHVKRTGDIGAFKVLSEAGLAAGVRRIEAATGMNAVQYTRDLERELGQTAELVRGSLFTTREKVEKLIAQRKELEREIVQLNKKLVSGGSRDLAAGAKKIGDATVLGTVVDVADGGALRELADSLRDKLAPSVVVLGAKAAEDKVLLVCTVSKELTARFKAGVLIKEVAAMVGGSGGGRPDFAQAGGTDPSKLESAVAKVYDLVT